MKYIESNYRHKMYSAGFHYILEFNTRTFRDRELYSSLFEEFVNMYGADKERMVTESYPKWKYNDNWRAEYTSSMNRRRIYLKESSAYTMAMLRIT